MAIDDTDMKKILERGDERYVRQNDCDDRHKEVDRRLADGNVNFALITHDLTLIKWALGIIASTAIASFVKSLIELIRG